MTGSSSTPETAAAIAEVLRRDLYATYGQHDTERTERLVDRVMYVLSCAGFTVVSGGEGLQHGAVIVDVGGEGPDQSEDDKALRLVLDQHHVELLDGEFAYAETDALVEKLVAAGFGFVRASGAAPGTTAEPAQRCPHCDCLGDLHDPYCPNRRRAAGATAPETTPAACPDCNGTGADFAHAHQRAVPPRCLSCAGSGVAETTP